MFSKARLGDTVFHIRHGAGQIITNQHTSLFSIQVLFPGRNRPYAYTLDGKCQPSDEFPSLYWSRPEIIAPPPPKRKVKKSGWTNLYRCTVYQTEEEARRDACGDAIAQVFVEYEDDE